MGWGGLGGGVGTSFKNREAVEENSQMIHICSENVNFRHI